MLNQLRNLNYLAESTFSRLGKNLKIGILGGSFNPPHNGHYNISCEAIKRLNLDLVLWLVTPLNPLKSKSSLQSLKTRLAQCNTLTKYYYKIKVLGLEESFTHHYSYLTLLTLTKLSSSGTQLFWIMGEDNLLHFTKFKYWQQFIENYKIVVFSRNTALATSASVQNVPSFKTLFSKCAIIYSNNRLQNNNSLNLIKKNPPAWVFFLIKRSYLSSTQLRKDLI